MRSPNAGAPAQPHPAQPSGTAQAALATPAASPPARSSTSVPVTAGVFAGSQPSPSHAGARRRVARRPAPVVGRFRLARAAVVRVLVQQQAPACRRVGRYSIRAPRGANVLPVRRRLGPSRHRLGAGTYRFIGTARGVEVLDRRIRLTVRGGILRVHRDQLEDVCTEETLAPAFATRTSAGESATGRAARPREGHGTARAEKRSGALLPPALRRLNPAEKSPFVRAVFFALLASAILLLATGTLPERHLAGVLAGYVLSRRRPEITLAGVSLLVAAALVTLFA